MLQGNITFCCAFVWDDGLWPHHTGFVSRMMISWLFTLSEEIKNHFTAAACIINGLQFITNTVCVNYIMPVILTLSSHVTLSFYNKNVKAFNFYSYWYFKFLVTENVNECDTVFFKINFFESDFVIFWIAYVKN